jgi:hypothetical protein
VAQPGPTPLVAPEAPTASGSTSRVSTSLRRTAENAGVVASSCLLAGRARVAAVIDPAHGAAIPVRLASGWGTTTAAADPCGRGPVRAQVAGAAQAPDGQREREQDYHEPAPAYQEPCRRAHRHAFSQIAGHLRHRDLRAGGGVATGTNSTDLGCRPAGADPAGPA